MATVKVSALTALPVANATYTYGITDAGTEGKVPVGGTNGLAGLASPALTGTPTAPTPTQDDNSTKIATTAYVDAGLGGSALAGPGVINTIAATGDTTTIGAAGPITVLGLGSTGTITSTTFHFNDGVAGQVIFITITKAVTTLTITGNVNMDATRVILANPTALTANQATAWVWDDSSSTPCWIRFQ